MTGALTVLIGWFPGLIVGALAETHSAAYKAAHTGGNAIGYWSFLPWREGFIAGWVLTLIPVAFVVSWFLNFHPFSSPTAGRTAGGLAYGMVGGVAAGLATIIMGLLVGVAFLVLPIGALS
jgi:hypothetical protein